MSLFLEIHATLLPLLRQSNAVLASDTVRNRIQNLRDRLMQAYCVHAFLAYERYLDMVSIRLENPALRNAFTVVGWDYFEKEFRKDPSQADIVVGLAVSKIRSGDPDRGRHLLRRVAASGYKERDLARLLLATPIS